LEVLDVDDRLDRLPHGVDGEVKPVAAPLLVDMACAARDMVAELVEIARDPPPRFLAAQLMRQVDVDRSLHGLKDEAPGVAFQSPAGFYGK
jgi:hypothetical protein